MAAVVKTMKGFTLIEMLVSVTIFTIIMTMALGALLSLSVADRKAETLKSGIDNLTFALDSMSRAIRTGQNYHCGDFAGTSPQDCANGSNMFTFLASNGRQTYYQLDLSQDPVQTDPSPSHCGQAVLPFGCIERSYDGTNWTPITSPDIVLQSAGFLFHAVGTQPTASSNYVQPKVTITASSTIPVSATQRTGVFMQTTVTERIYDQ